MTLHNFVGQTLGELGYDSNPYFVNLRNGQFQKADFVETQVQFYFAVIFFSRPMAALAAKIPTPELRVEIVRNVWEEHGEGMATKIHGTTFREFLKRLDNVSSGYIESRMLWPEVRMFNTTLVGTAVLDDYLVGCGMMGIIERMFSDISVWIGQGIVEQGWVSESQMVHYKIHQNLDVKHSQDFFNVLEHSWNAEDKSQYLIKQGLLLGAYIFDALYRGLWQNRHRRWECGKLGPPSQSEGIS